MIPYGRQEILDADIKAVVGVLRSDFLTQGPAVARFEQFVASRVRAKHAIAVNSATSALHIACMALGVAPGDRVWTVPNTFVASANCARYEGAEIDFVDIDPETWNLDVSKLREKLVRARRDDRLPKVVIPVHFAGQPTDQEAIWELAHEFGFRVVEDASHAIGASRNGEPVGSCRWSDIVVFSFHPVKIITTGEGGMALTNDDGLAERMCMLRSHGITRDPTRLRGEEFAAVGSPEICPPPAWYYEQQMLGYNYRMTDIQAALGISQLDRLQKYVMRRNALARRYDAALAGAPLQLPFVQPGNVSAFHLYVVRLQSGATASAHRRIFEELRTRGIAVNVHYMPVHLQPYYRDLGFAPGGFPEAEAHGRSAITLPLFAALTDGDQDDIIDAVRETLGS
jgi:UDP-4-amino-4,6-dideoxy-N-acetyl-beta-L-altrosamine transaminase